MNGQGQPFQLTAEQRADIARLIAQLEEKAPGSQPAAGAGTQPEASEPDLKELGKFLVIREQAASLAALIAKVKPDFTFGQDGRDMMWLRTDAKGQPLFVLDSAWVYRPAGRKPAYLLVDVPRRVYDWPEGLEGGYLRAEAELTDDDNSGNQANDQPPYAIIRGQDKKGGTLYEIGWTAPFGSMGSGIHEKGRHLYVLREPAGRWRFVGEGHQWSADMSGGESSDVTSECRVAWTGKADAPVRLLFTSTSRQSNEIRATNLGDGPRRDDLEVRTQSVLDGPLPANLRKLDSRPYLVTRKGDTLDKLAGHLASWTARWAKNQKDEAARAWRVELVRLNPKLPAGEIPPGTRVHLLTAAEEAALFATPTASPPAPPTQPAGSVGGEWQPLYSDMSGYRDAAGPERVYVGEVFVFDQDIPIPEIVDISPEGRVRYGNNELRRLTFAYLHTADPAHRSMGDAIRIPLEIARNLVGKRVEVLCKQLPKGGAIAGWIRLAAIPATQPAAAAKWPEGLPRPVPTTSRAELVTRHADGSLHVKIKPQLYASELGCTMVETEHGAASQVYHILQFAIDGQGYWTIWDVAFGSGRMPQLDAGKEYDFIIKPMAVKAGGLIPFAEAIPFAVLKVSLAGKVLLDKTAEPTATPATQPHSPVPATQGDRLPDPKAVQGAIGGAWELGLHNALPQTQRILRGHIRAIESAAVGTSGLHALNTTCFPSTSRTSARI